MAFTFSAAGSFVTDTGGDSTLLLPYPSVANGNLILAGAYARDGTTTIATPSGYTLLDSIDSGRHVLFAKVADGSETGNLTLTATGPGEIFVGQIVVFASGATGWALALHAVANQTNSGTVDLEIPALAVTQDNTVVFAWVGRNVDNTPYLTPPANFTQSGEGGDGNVGSFVCGASAYWIQTTQTSVAASTAFDSASAGTGNSKAIVASLTSPAVSGMALPVRPNRFATILQL